MWGLSIFQVTLTSEFSRIFGDAKQGDESTKPESEGQRPATGRSRKKRKIALLKVDVEGDEVRVLEGITAQWWYEIEQVVVEVQDERDERNAEHQDDGTDKAEHVGSVETVVMLLRSAGFDLVAARQSRYAGNPLNNKIVVAVRK